jgi:hypothetical protein
MAVLSSAVNIGEVIPSARSTAADNIGAGRSATAYQRASTRHLDNRAIS